MDISDFARQLVEMVTRLSNRGKKFERNFTLNHLVDILRGSKAKTIKDRFWDKDTFYNVSRMFFGLRRLLKYLHVLVLYRSNGKFKHTFFVFTLALQRVIISTSVTAMTPHGMAKLFDIMTHCRF